MDSMTAKNQRLELTWIGKENRPKLEPRILLEDPEKSHHAAHRVTDHDIFDNRLIFGDNLLALKALEQEFAGKVKCVFIDPPYNTGTAFAHYDDGVEHSLWLSLMRDRLELIRTLLSADGSLWITIDDNEAHYLKVLCDEVFGRANFVANVVWQKIFLAEEQRKTTFGESRSRAALRAPNRAVATKSPATLKLPRRQVQESGRRHERSLDSRSTDREKPVQSWAVCCNLSVRPIDRWATTGSLLSRLTRKVQGSGRGQQNLVGPDWE